MSVMQTCNGLFFSELIKRHSIFFFKVQFLIQQRPIEITRTNKGSLVLTNTEQHAGAETTDASVV